MRLAGLLGANLWLVAVAVPLAVGRGFARSAPSAAVAAVVLLACLGPALLLSGLLRRSGALLLAAFPAAATLPQAVLAGGDPATRLLPPAPFLVGAVSLVGYLVAAAFMLRRAELAAEPAPDFVRPAHGAAPIGARWRRRRRVYRGLAMLVALFPVALIAEVGLGGRAGEPLGAFGDAGPSRAVLIAAAACLTMVLYRSYLLEPLEAHLQQDQGVRAELDAARRQARRGRPRAAFYGFVLLALFAMAAVLWQRVHR